MKFCEQHFSDRTISSHYMYVWEPYPDLPYPTLYCHNYSQGILAWFWQHMYLETDVESVSQSVCECVSDFLPTRYDVFSTAFSLLVRHSHYSHVRSSTTDSKSIRATLCARSIHLATSSRGYLASA